MDFRTFSEPTNLTFKMDNIVKVSYQVNSLEFKQSCSILLVFHDSNDDRFYKQILLTGDAYKNWNDDDYIETYLNNMINKMIA